MDIYKVEVGEGKNPMLASVATQLGENVELNEIHDLSELLLSSDVQDLLAGVSATDLIDKLDRLSKLKKKGNDHTLDTMQTEDRIRVEKEKPNGKEQNVQDKPKAKEQKVHEQLIDAETIEKVRKSVLVNVTSSVKVEL